MKAEKSLIQDLFSYLIFSMIIMFMLSAVILFINIADNDHYSKYTRDVLERHGSCSSQAKSEIANYSKTRFNDRYELRSCTQKGSGFGSTINFQIKGKFSLIFIDTPFNLGFGGTSTVLKRTY